MKSNIVFDKKILTMTEEEFSSCYNKSLELWRSSGYEPELLPECLVIDLPAWKAYENLRKYFRFVEESWLLCESGGISLSVYSSYVVLTREIMNLYGLTEEEVALNMPPTPRYKGICIGEAPKFLQYRGLEILQDFWWLPRI